MAKTNRTHQAVVSQLNAALILIVSGPGPFNETKTIKGAIYCGRRVFIVEAAGESTMVMATLENAVMHYNSF